MITPSPYRARHSKLTICKQSLAALSTTIQPSAKFWLISVSFNFILLNLQHAKLMLKFPRILFLKLPPNFIPITASKMASPGSTTRGLLIVWSTKTRELSSEQASATKIKRKVYLKSLVLNSLRMLWMAHFWASMIWAANSLSVIYQLSNTSGCTL